MSQLVAHDQFDNELTSQWFSVYRNPRTPVCYSRLYNRWWLSNNLICILSIIDTLFTIQRRAQFKTLKRLSCGRVLALNRLSPVSFWLINRRFALKSRVIVEAYNRKVCLKGHQVISNSRVAQGVLELVLWHERFLGYFDTSVLHPIWIIHVSCMPYDVAVTLGVIRFGLNLI